MKILFQLVKVVLRGIVLDGFLPTAVVRIGFLLAVNISTFSRPKKFSMMRLLRQLPFHAIDWTIKNPARISPAPFL